MSFDIEQYELDYDEHPPTPNNELRSSRENSREYGPALPLYLPEESAPEDPTVVGPSRMIGPPDMRPSTSQSLSTERRRDDEFSTLPSLNANEFPVIREVMELPEDNDFLISGNDRDANLFPTPSPPTISNCSADVNVRVIGPTLPSEPLVHRRSTNGTNEGEDDENGDERRVIGPTIPSFLAEPCFSTRTRKGENGSTTAASASVYGPTLPSSFASSNNSSAKNDTRDGGDSDDDVIGPSLPSSSNNADERDAEYYYRFMKLQEKKITSNVPRREEWMTELPQSLRQSYGLSAKSAFSASSAIPSSVADKSRSEWTKTPKAAPSMPAEPQPQTSKSSDTNKPTQQESLLEIYQRKRKGNCDQGPVVKSGERIPFNRDVDMEIYGLSKMTAEEAKNRAGNLVSRFESSSSSRFL